MRKIFNSKAGIKTALYLLAFLLFANPINGQNSEEKEASLNPDKIFKYVIEVPDTTSSEDKNIVIIFSEEEKIAQKEASLKPNTIFISVIEGPDTTGSEDRNIEKYFSEEEKIAQKEASLNPNTIFKYVEAVPDTIKP